MKFTIKTINESRFKDALQKMVDENEIQFPTARTIHRDSSTGLSTYVLSDSFINNLNKLNPELIKTLEAIR